MQQFLTLKKYLKSEVKNLRQYICKKYDGNESILDYGDKEFFNGKMEAFREVLYFLEKTK